MKKLTSTVCVLALIAFVLYGQGFTSLSGVVSDPTGAVVPNASVTVTNTQTGAVRETKADASGRYLLAQITPGTYNLVAKAAGFSDVAINAIELLVNSPATVNVTFEKVGAVTTTVSVEAAAVQVNTTDASLGNAIGTQAIAQLPFFARNAAGLLQYQPGVTSFGTNISTTPLTNDDRNGAVNGGKSDQANVTLDGVDVNDQANRTAFTSVLRVTLDSVQEFRTTTTNENADAGRGSGADVALVTKSGTNNFHGSLYEYHRNTITAANSFFNNRTGVARPALLINVFGGSLGGPIIKNRTFFFINFEGRRDASATNVSRTVPSDDLRAGIVHFTNTAGKDTTIGPDVIKNVVDPLHIGPNPNSLKLFNNVFPHGNDTSLGDGLNIIGFRFSAPTRADQNTYIARFDHRLDSAGKHTLFARGNLQNDSANGVPEFPGQPPLQVNLNNSKGLAAGWTGILRPNLVSTFRYGFTRYGAENSGVLTSSFSSFRSLSNAFGTSTGFTQIVPVHTIGQDFAWTKGAHDVRFGGLIHLVNNGTTNFAHSFNNATSNLSWLKGSGADIEPASLQIASSSLASYGDAMMALLGILSQGTGNYNYTIQGATLPTGAPVVRHFKNEEYEMYAQDSWKMTRNLTVTAGIRYQLMPPIYEADNIQISADRSISDWLNQRGGLAQQGLPQTQAGDITYVLANSPQGRPLYPYHKNWSPRAGIAYSPRGDSGLSKFLFGGPGKTSIRAGFGMYYDIIGQPLASTFNANAFGLATSLTNPANSITSAVAPRFTDFFTVPSALVGAAPPGGFPAKQPKSGKGSFAITNSIDDKLQAPYTMNMNFSIGRELGKGFFIQGSYVGRLARKSLIERDLAMPTDLKDPASGQSYFQAMSAIGKALYYDKIPLSQIPKQPFFEKFWAGAAAGGFTATQIIAKDLLDNSFPGDFTNTLFDIDERGICDPGGTSFLKDGSIDTVSCSIFGPNAIFNEQFSALSAWSSIGGGDYHSMQWTLRKRFSQGLLFDLNYTFAKSTDLASRSETAGFFGQNGIQTTAAGFVYNSWNPSQLRGVSDYDTLHAVNAYGVWQIPFGRGRKFGSNMNKILDAVVGGWQISGTYRQTSGLPTSATDGRRWPTNWELSSFATPTGSPLPPVTNNENAPAVSGKGGPNLWSDPKAALAAFGLTLAGQSGSRNTIRGAGFFDIDSGVGKSFNMPYSERHKLQFRWEAFNLTNSVRLDPGTVSTSLTSSSNFGKLTSQLGSPRQMQFALRYDF